MNPWKTLDSVPLVDDRWMRLTADRCCLPNGSVIDRYYVIHENDWVHVFAQRDDSQILVVRQFRYAVGIDCVELPGGVVDKGESPLDAAKRELLEETGYASDEWISIGRMYADPARQTNSVHIFFASNVKQVAEQRLDNSEALALEFVTAREVQSMISRNEFSQAHHIASFYRVLNELAARNSRLNACLAKPHHL